MLAVLDARKAQADAAAAAQQASVKPSGVDTALKQAGAQPPAAAAAGSPAASSSDAAAAAGPAAAAPTAATLDAALASGINTLELSVRLLAGMRWAGLDQLDAARGSAKKLAVYR
jgi:hypothetical protein